MSPLIIITLLLLSFLTTNGQTIDHASFADALTAELYTKDNECSSSFGVSMAFSLVYPSSTGDSANQIQQVFGYPSGSQGQLVWNETASRLDSAYKGECQSSFFGECENELPLLEIANSIWIDDGTQLNPTYVDVVGNDVRQIDFDDQGAAGIINDWVSDSTNGLIDSIVPEGSLSQMLLIAVNTIYLKASWLKAFMEQRTNEDVFYSSPSRDTEAAEPKAHFMHKVDNFPYSHDALPGFQILQLPFIDNALSMLFVLPINSSSGTATSTNVLNALPMLGSTRVALALPKFKFESQYGDDLKTSLKNVGLTAPFEGGLCIFENDCSKFVDQVIQKTIIDVNELGVEAAAATMLAVPTSAPPEVTPVLFMADHPFQFFIYDSNEDLVIFEGRVGAPGIHEDSPDPQLQAKHADDDFWSSTFWLAEAPTIVSQQGPNTQQTQLPDTQETQAPSSAYPLPFLGVSACLAMIICCALEMIGP